MKVYRNDKIQKLKENIVNYKSLLKSQKIVRLISSDHEEVISAVTAWFEVGGNLAIINPLLPEMQLKHLQYKFNELDCENSIIFHTSGTTGMPKTVVQDRKFILKTAERCRDITGFNKDTCWVNVIPAATSGFVHIVVANLYLQDASVILADRSTLVNDFSNSNANNTLVIPGLIDLINASKINIPFENLSRICVGGSPFLDKHARYLFSNGANEVCHCYGTTETGSPILSKRSLEYNDDTTFLEINEECSFEGEELIFEEHKTGDLFNRKGNLIQFKGRNNDIVKMNGYMTNLFLIEKEVEKLFDGIDTLAIVKKRLGTEFIELLHTGTKEIIRKDIEGDLEKIIPPCNIPLKLTKVAKIPRNSMNKKIRHGL